jgi:prepilin-type N-terminal cleavage/methylation domain-containing protein
MAGCGESEMRTRRGFTLIEMVAVSGIAAVVASLVGTLYLTVGRAVETEKARSEMLAGAREVLSYIKRDVRQADALSASNGRLVIIIGGRQIKYANATGGISRQAGGGTRLLGSEGLRANFQVLGGRGVATTLIGKHTVRSREISLRRESFIARRRL